jgi:glucose/arabinose dehydrogenase
VGLAWEPVTGALWTCVNERDGLGDNTPPDYATSVKDGGFYGWPYAYLGSHPDPNFGSKRPDLVAQSIFPDVPIQAHSAPLGMAFDTANLFPADYKNGLFIATHGSWNRSHRTGYNVLFQPMKDGKPDGRYVVFANGWATPDQQVWGRPVSLAFAADGALLISDDGSNKIWRVAPASAPPGSAGDVNEDGSVNVQDVTFVLRAVVGATSLSPVQKFAADQYPVGAPDNQITISDVLVLLRMALGLPVK